MRASRRAQSRTGRRGFSLMEILVVIAILGLALTFGLAGLNAALKRQRLNSAAEEVKSLAGRALTEAESRNVQTFLVFGDYVDGVGTDVAVVVDTNGNGVLDEAYDPNGDGLLDDASPTVVLRRTRVPAEVFLIAPVDASPVQWAAAGAQVQWRVSPPPGSATPTFSTAILCDSRGRAMVPGTPDTPNPAPPPATLSGNPPSMIPGPATIQLTHRDMVAGSLTPLVTYTVSIGPLYKAAIGRVP